VASRGDLVAGVGLGRMVPRRPAWQSSKAWTSPWRVHHKRAVGGDGLADGLAAEDRDVELGLRRSWLRAASTQRLMAPAPVVPPAAPIRYRVMSTVPENWIPFIPVHVEGSNREIQLQRAAMPRILGSDTQKVRPRTSVLRVGLGAVPAEPYLLHEEEVPRAGTKVSVSYRRTRWTGGRVVVWLAARRETWRGEASSGLAFDLLVPTEAPPA
jgi:hypothetical protein